MSLIIAVLSSLTVGFLAGFVMSRFKAKTLRISLQEKINHLEIQMQERKEFLEQQLTQVKEQSRDHQVVLERQLVELRDQREKIREEKDLLRDQLTRKTTTCENLQEKLTSQKEELEKLQEKFSVEFENLAGKILEQNSEKFTTLNKENIQNILDPLQARIKTFEEKVERNSHDFIERHAQLGKQLQHLNDQNLKISQEATNLTRALKGDSQKQGSWGEIILESVLEKSGLRKGIEYFVQETNASADGKRLRPDVTLYLPGDKKLIIDSKVSLNAYERYCSQDDPQEKDQSLKQHIKAVQLRVRELSQKKYHHLHPNESPDFVLLFLPIEGAFAVASQEYPGLYNEAFEQHIILVTPTTLLAVLKTVDSMWQNEKQKQNALDIATQAGNLYDAFSNLTEELLKLGRQLGTVQNSYEGAMKKLTGKGNLIRRVEKLKQLGAKASKQMDQQLLKEAKAAAEEEENIRIS